MVPAASVEVACLAVRVHAPWTTAGLSLVTCSLKLALYYDGTTLALDVESVGGGLWGASEGRGRGPCRRKSTRKPGEGRPRQQRELFRRTEEGAKAVRQLDSRGT